MVTRAQGQAFQKGSHSGSPFMLAGEAPRHSGGGRTAWALERIPMGLKPTERFSAGKADPVLCQQWPVGKCREGETSFPPSPE